MHVHWMSAVIYLLQQVFKRNIGKRVIKKYPFQRYNGVLEGTPINNRLIEVQIMQRFLWDINNFSLLQCSDIILLHATASLMLSLTRHRLSNQCQTVQERVIIKMPT